MKMRSYTDRLEAGAADFYEYEALEKLPRIIASFRGFGAALDDFLVSNGYPGSAKDSADKKAAFLKEKLC